MVDYMGVVKMYALIEFDNVITQEQYNKLKDIYDFGEVTTRCYKDYDGKIKPMEKDELYASEVEECTENGDIKCINKKTGEEVYSFHVKKDFNEDKALVCIERCVHLVDLEKLYKRCPKLQVRILELPQ